MAGNYLPDTNALISYLRNDLNAIEKFDQINELNLSVIVLGELFFGAYNSANAEKNINKIVELSSYGNIIPIDNVVSHVYGDIKNELRKKGRPIPENDIWIAATAITYNLTIISNDQHFAQVSKLTIES